MNEISMVARFLGYGRPSSAKYWFVGPEEAGGERSARERVWKGLGSPELMDVAEFHAKLAEELSDDRLARLFDSKRTLVQPTWRGLIRIALDFEGSSEPADEEGSRIREFQVGRLSKDAMLLECKGGQDKRENRGRVPAEVVTRRVSRILDLVSEHAPRLVVFYGKTAWGYAGDLGIAAQHSTTVETKRRSYVFRYGISGRTVVGAVPHPNAHGLTAEHWRGFGRTLREMSEVSGN